MGLALAALLVLGFGYFIYRKVKGAAGLPGNPSPRPVRKPQPLEDE